MDIPNRTLMVEGIGDSVLLLCLRILFKEKYPETHYKAYRGTLVDLVTNDYLKTISLGEGIPPVGDSATAYGKAAEVYLGELFLAQGLEAAKAEIERLIEKYTGWEKITSQVESRFIPPPPPKEEKPKKIKAPKLPKVPKAQVETSPPQELPIVKKPTGICRRYKFSELPPEIAQDWAHQPTTLYSGTLGGHITQAGFGTWRADHAASYFLEDAIKLAQILKVTDLELLITEK